mgnify:CR=1 FL=1
MVLTTTNARCFSIQAARSKRLYGTEKVVCPKDNGWEVVLV